MVASWVSGVGVSAQSSFPVSSPGLTAPPSDPLVLGMLQSVDLPPGMVAATDIQEGADTDFDAAAFTAHGGIRSISRTWGMDAAAGPTLVFDIRMQFPTPEAAAAYLAVALPTLSETDTTHLRPLPDVPDLGRTSHAYGLDVPDDAAPVVIRNYVFQDGPVVSKVLAGGPGITAEQAEAIAVAAAARVRQAGTPAPGTPAPAPSPGPVGTSAAPLPSGDLVPLLRAHVPEVIAATCTPDEQRLWQGELTTLVCSPTDADVQVTYSGFDTVDDMGRAYQSSLDTIDLSSAAASCDQGTFTGTYQVDGEDVGQVTCWSEPNGRAIMWSDDRLSILSVAVSPSLDPAALYLWWLDAGPDP